jgi:hypothetical protein
VPRVPRQASQGLQLRGDRLQGLRLLPQRLALGQRERGEVERLDRRQQVGLQRVDRWQALLEHQLERLIVVGLIIIIDSLVIFVRLLKLVRLEFVGLKLIEWFEGRRRLLS